MNTKFTEEFKQESKDISFKVIGAAMEVHRHMGPGLLESSYEECLCRELAQRGIPFTRQVAVPLVYKGVRLEGSLRLDLLVAGLVIVGDKGRRIGTPSSSGATLDVLEALKPMAWPSDQLQCSIAEGWLNEDAKRMNAFFVNLVLFSFVPSW